MVLILAGREPARLAEVPETPTPPPRIWRQSARTSAACGRIYEKKASKDLARREYEAALKADPALRDAQAALKKLS
jgi:hypothetical protein